MAEIIGRVGWKNYVSPISPLWNNLVAYWSGDNTANDSKGTYNGTLINGATYSTGKISNGFILDGVNDYVATVGGSPIDSDKAHTYSCWIKPSSVSGTTGLIGNGVSIFAITNGSLCLLQYWINQASISNISISINTWTHVAVVFKGNSFGANNVLFYINGSLGYTGTLGMPSGGSNIVLGAGYSGAGYYNGLIDEIGTWSRALTGAEVTELYNAGAGKQYVAPTPTYTTRTAAFAAATGITDATILGALNTFDTGLISNGLATKMKALYPFVGGTANTHKYNFMDARDTNAAFRLTFSGGWVHSSNGVLANGTNGYADTYYNLQSLNQNNTHLSIYNTNNYTPTESIDMGAFNEISANGVLIATEIVPGLSRARIFKNALDYTLTDNRGYFLANSNSTNSQYYINNVNRSTIANSGTFPLDSRNIYIGALNGTYGYYFANGKYTFSSIGDGLTPSEATTFYNLVQAFQTALSRQV